MDQKEKMLFLELLMRSIRMDWVDHRDRLNKAKKLAGELKLNKVIARLDKFKESYSGTDGRYLRDDIEQGGYEGMCELHKLSRNVMDKSEEFQHACDKYLTYPEEQLDDWGEYKRTYNMLELPIGQIVYMCKDNKLGELIEVLDGRMVKYYDGGSSELINEANMMQQVEIY